MKLQLIPEWKQAWRLWSVRIYALLIVLPEALALMSPELREALPPQVSMAISAVAFVGIVARLVKQADKSG